MEEKIWVDEFFDRVGESCYSETTRYRFAKYIDYGSEKYKKGIISSLTWISNLAAWYQDEVKRMQKEFLQRVEYKKEELKFLKEGDFKRGLMDGFKMGEEIIKMYKK